MRTESVLQLLRFKEIGAIIALIVIFAFFEILNSQFMSISNLTTILETSAELGIMTLGVNLVMIAGEFDMSVASIYVLVPVIFEFLTLSGLPSIVSMIIALLFAAGQGFINGFITTKGHIPSFITTLGTEYLWLGVTLAITGGYFVSLTKGKNIIDIFSAQIGSTSLRLSILWFIGLTIVFYLIIEKTKYGNRVMASGGNPAVADSLGVQSWKYKTSAFVISGITAGLAGFALFGRFQSIDTSFGTGMELQSITASVIGGTLMTGGYGSAFGAFLGAIILSSLDNGLVLAGAPTFWYQAFVGIILIAAALLNIRLKTSLVGG
ncbi:MAG: ABC transporter permease [Candidatus Parvarchaeota archaeon]|nr:ABC transporter permease [Candidatus Jingweiarchaeum tengchongense]MCW1305936.1 ABC transporter permease [Candidatus Jingweiarchaeum tengchongense]